MSELKQEITSLVKLLDSVSFVKTNFAAEKIEQNIQSLCQQLQYENNNLKAESATLKTSLNLLQHKLDI